jgi:hypothetical protein
MEALNTINLIIPEAENDECLVSSIICMNLREHKYYIYGTNGIL